MERKTVSIPPFIVTPADVSRLRRELAGLDEFYHQQQLRSNDVQTVSPPAISRLLAELAAADNINFEDAVARRNLLDFLADMTANAPVVHISFSADPPPVVLRKVVQWFRENIHPNTLLRVGLQPNIAAGCIVRTSSHYYDLSLRQSFIRSRAALVKALEIPEQHE